MSDWIGLLKTEAWVWWGWLSLANVPPSQGVEVRSRNAVGGFALFEVSCALETGEWLSDQTSLVDQIQRELTDPFQDGFNWLIPWW